MPSLLRFIYRLLLVLAVLAAMSGLGIWYSYQSFLDKAVSWQPELVNSQSDGFVFEIPAGSNLNLVIAQLQEYGLSHPQFTRLYAKLTDRQQIKAGEYQISITDTPRSLVEKFNNGDVLLYSVTLVEGIRARSFIEQLEQHPRLLPDTQTMTIEELKVLLGITSDNIEGWLFPDTYVFSSNTRVSAILKQAHQRMQDVLKKAWSSRAPNLPLETPYDALILASIVEKETGAAYERQRIAGVFVKRLQLGMKLQTDPTVIYGLGERYQGNLKRSHLRELTPYNTYKIHGLPPTPIASPGADAIHAAVNPQISGELFFVAKGDGSHYFSVTLEEHNKAVRQYQINQRKKNYRSSPAD